jgi:hypothetical protein
MTSHARRSIAVFLLLVLVIHVAPAFADEEPGSEPVAVGARSPRRTKALWTIVGAAAGAGVGMWAGFHAFDQATYAERKITTATIAGGAIGAVVGWTIGWGRSRAASRPSTETRISVARSKLRAAY